METRNGVIEFRNHKVTEQVVVRREDHKEVTKQVTSTVLEFRQCFKGIWTPWKPVIQE
jgi:hypothetical protein